MNRHLSPDDIARWTGGEHTAEQERHLRECPPCSAEVEKTDHDFALFRESGKRWSDHWYVQQPEPASMPASRPRLRIAVAMAACAAFCLVLLRSSAPRIATQVPDAPFVEIPYVAPLAPYERTEVVRMDVSVAALQAAGVDVQAPDTGGTVLADMVLGQDGRAHAIRLVSEQERSNRRMSQ